jgi:GNAT-like C-terminal domain/N-acyltransferase N-terminal domain
MQSLSAEGRMAANDLGLGAEYADWLASIDRAPDDGLELPLYTSTDAATLERLGVTDEDAAAVLAARRQLDRAAAFGWLLRQCRRLVVAHMGDPSAPELLLPQLPEALGLPGRCFPVHLFLGTLPVTQQWQRRHGIPAEEASAVFADLGRHMAIYRRVHGETGVDEPWWLLIHLRALIYEFGRLQYNLLTIGAGWLSPQCWYDAQADRLGTGFRPGDDGLGIHIPEDGPLTPQNCAESVAAARAFFDRRFPSATRRLAICESWLLDDQLTEYLSADTNIIRFQRQFTLVPGWRPGDKAVAQFVFRRTVDNLAGVPQRTTLQRAILSHLRAGRHWRVRCGWLKL